MKSLPTNHPERRIPANCYDYALNRTSVSDVTAGIDRSWTANEANELEQQWQGSTLEHTLEYDNNGSLTAV